MPKVYNMPNPNPAGNRYTLLSYPLNLFPLVQWRLRCINVLSKHPRKSSSELPPRLVGSSSSPFVHHPCLLPCDHVPRKAEQSIYSLVSVYAPLRRALCVAMTHDRCHPSLFRIKPVHLYLLFASVYGHARRALCVSLTHCMCVSSFPFSKPNLNKLSQISARSCRAVRSFLSFLFRLLKSMT